LGFLSFVKSIFDPPRGYLGFFCFFSPPFFFSAHFSPPKFANLVLSFRSFFCCCCGLVWLVSGRFSVLVSTTQRKSPDPPPPPGPSEPLPSVTLRPVYLTAASFFLFLFFFCISFPFFALFFAECHCFSLPSSLQDWLATFCLTPPQTICSTNLLFHVRNLFCVSRLFSQVFREFFGARAAQPCLFLPVLPADVFFFFFFFFQSVKLLDLWMFRLSHP